MRDEQTDCAVAPAPFPVELLVWLSPSFPIGGFAYSQGLETAVDRGWVTDARSLTAWLSALIHHGALHNDLILMALIFEAKTENQIDEITALSKALQPSAERAAEALTQGRSFAAAFEAGWLKSPGRLTDGADLTLPVAVAFAARSYGFDAGTTLEAFALSFCSNAISAAIRLGVIGQFDGQRITAQLLPDMRLKAHTATRSTIADLGSATYGADLATMLHETQTTRLFRS